MTTNDLSRELGLKMIINGIHMLSGAAIDDYTSFTMVFLYVVFQTSKLLLKYLFYICVRRNFLFQQNQVRTVNAVNKSWIREIHWGIVYLFRTVLF